MKSLGLKSSVLPSFDNRSEPLETDFMNSSSGIMKSGRPVFTNFFNYSSIIGVVVS